MTMTRTALVATTRLSLAVLGVCMAMLLASGPAQASTGMQRNGVATGLHTGIWCTAYREKSAVTAYGFVNVGYFEIDVGICYDTTTWRSTLNWGPYCYSQWYVPWIRTVATNYCYSYRDYYTGVIHVYGAWTAQAFIIPIGWCCDRYFSFGYGT
jgi:hypothetical protein